MSATTELAARIALWWMDRRPFSEGARARRKAKRAARKAQRQRQPDEASGEFLSNSNEEGGIVLQGKKTYIGIATAVLGFLLARLGLGDESSGLSAELVGAADELLTVVGLALAAYGRAKANK